MTKFRQVFWSSLFNPHFAPTALRVALFVGTILLIINHGQALFTGQMTRVRWIFAVLTYCVPYMVNIHGQVAVLPENGSKRTPVIRSQLPEQYVANVLGRWLLT